MPISNPRKTTALLAIFLVAIIIIGFFAVREVGKPSSKLTPSPAPTTSPLPSGATPTASAGTTTPLPTVPPVSSMPSFPPQTAIPTSSSVSGLFPGEVTQFDGQSLTPIQVFIDDVEAHPDVAIMGTQYLNQSTYTLTVTGLVNHPVEYTYNDIVNNFTSYNNVATLLCVEGWSVTCLWQGVLVSDLIKEAGVSPDANTIIFSASDGYTTSLPLDYITQDDITLAYKMNNVTLPAVAGFPLVLVPPDQYGYKWIKWVTQIDVSNDSSYQGYWESRGYPNNATVGNPSVAPVSTLVAAETLGFVAVGVVVVVAVYMILVKVKRRYSSGEEGGDAYL